METELLQNPFFLLQVSLKDNKQKIIEKAHSLVLKFQEEEITKASSELTIIKNRLPWEMKHFLDLDLEAENLLRELYYKRSFIYELSSYFPLSQINILEFALKTVQNLTMQEFEEFTSTLIYLYENLDLEEVKKKINEKRQSSAFPLLENSELLREEFEKKRREAINLLLKTFDKFSLVKKIKVMTKIVENETNSAEFQASFMVDDLLDDYKHSFSSLLEDGFLSIRTLIEKIIDEKIQHENIDKIISSLLARIKKWNQLARPIQISLKARGLSHDLSIELANLIRVSAIEIYNKYNNMEFFIKISALLKELFGDFPEILYQLDEDIKSLKEIEVKKQQNREFFDSLNYSTKIGILDKELFSISIGGVSWQGKHYLLDEITLMKWGIYKDQFSGLSYSITFGNEKDISRIKTKKNEIYEEIINRFWKMIGMNILSKMLKSFSRGEFLEYENIRIYDEKVLFLPENKSLLWEDLLVYNENSFLLLEGRDQSLKAELSYQNLYNIYFLETAIKSMKNMGNAKKLSQVISSQL